MELAYALLSTEVGVAVREVSALSDAERAILRERLCFAEEGAPISEERCPPELRASEVKLILRSRSRVCRTISISF
jgi:hypothetical protein